MDRVAILNRISLLGLALALVVLVGPGMRDAVQGAHSSSPGNFFPVAVWYSGGKARAPMLEPVTAASEDAWRADLLKIKGLGFNTVRTWVEWNTGEPREGEYHLENLDLLLKLAEESGLRVEVQVYVDSAPEWVGAKYADGRYAAQDGQPIPSQAAPGYCFDHPGVRQAVLDFYREVAQHAGKSPAFYAWDLWSEPAALNWARIGYKAEPMFCYCPSSIARFRIWLQRKYGTLDKLNEAWHRTFTDWKQVEPPRYGTILTYTDFMDWRIFYGEKLAEDLKARNDAVKSVDPSHATTSHAPNPSPLVRTLADPYDPTDDYLMKDSVDYFGTSFYPKLTSPEHNWSLERRVLAMDATASMTGGRGFFVGELQSGYGIHGTTVGSPVTGADLEMWTWGMVSRGARAINYYAFYPMSAGYESGGYGMVNLDGSLTDRSRHAGEIAKEIQTNADLLLEAKPEPAEAAVVFSPLAPLVGGYDEDGSRTAMHQAVAGYHRMFFERNLRLDVLSARELAQDHLERYKLVIVPYPLMLTGEEADTLRAYAEGGGHLFIEARPGWVDERGHAQERVPGFGWDRMLGVREIQVAPGKQFTVRWGAATFKTMTFAERFDTESASTRPVATLEDGTPVAYAKTVGKGSAMLLGSFAGQQNYREPANMHPLGDILADWAGLTRPRLEAPSLVELREMGSPEGRFIFLFNHGDKAAHVRFLRSLERPAKSIRIVTAGTSLPLTGSTISLDIEVPESSVHIVRIDY